MIFVICGPVYASPSMGNQCYTCHGPDKFKPPVLEIGATEGSIPPDHSSYDPMIASGAMNCGTCHAAQTTNPGDHSKYDLETTNCAECHADWELIPPAPVDNDKDDDGHDVIPAGDDCDDDNASVNPDAVEDCDDGIDNNCDNLIDTEDTEACPVDADGDGYTADKECNDNDETIHPGAVEYCDNIDNDCDGKVDDNCTGCDNGATRQTTCGIGECANTGTESCVNHAWVSNCEPLQGTEEICDGLDNDCDGQVDNGLPEEPTTCGQGECTATGVKKCINGVLTDTCKEGTPTDEVCDGLDNDCDGEADNDLDGSTTTCGQGACAGNTGTMQCAEGASIDTCDPFAGATEEICDQIDNDCDGQVDEGLDCPCFGDETKTVECGEGACRVSITLHCVDGDWEDSTCVPGEPTAEICDGIDNDCNGQVDDGIAQEPTTCGEGECAGTGALTCVNGKLVDTCEETCQEPEDPIGCGDSTCPWSGKEEGTLTVTGGNFPEDVTAIKVVLYPAGTIVTPILARTIRSSEGVTIIKPDGSSKTLVSSDDYKTPATICGGRHRVVVKVYYAGKLKGAMTTTHVVINGNSTLTLDYNELKFD